MALQEKDQRGIRHTIIKALYFTFGIPLALFLLTYFLPENAEWGITARDALRCSIVWVALCFVWYGGHFTRIFVLLARRRSREDFLCLEMCSIIAECIAMKQGLAEVDMLQSEEKWQQLQQPLRDLQSKIDAAMLRNPEFADIFRGYGPGAAYTVSMEFGKRRTEVTATMEMMDNYSGRLARALLIILSKDGEPVATAMQNRPDPYMLSRPASPEQEAGSGDSN